MWCNCSYNKVVEMEASLVELSLGCGTFWEVKLVCHIPTHTHVTVQVLGKNKMTCVTSPLRWTHWNVMKFFHMVDTPLTT